MQNRPNVLCSAPGISAAARAALDAVADVDYVDDDMAHIASVIHQYDAWWGHFRQRADAELLAKGTKLVAYNTTSTGTDHVDKQALAEHGIELLCIARDIDLLNSFTATAELAFQLLQGCMRNFRAANRAAHAGDWSRGSDRFEGSQLSGKTLGVLGVGRLGRMMVDYGKGFRMNVIGCDHLDFEIHGVERVTHGELFAQSDAISLHIHMTEENFHIINAQVLAKMKPGAILINTSRGDLIDEEALIASLESGYLRAFGADVVHNEWRDDMSENAIVEYARTHDNVVLTPHIGGATEESVSGAQVFSARKLADFLSERK